MLVNDIKESCTLWRAKIVQQLKERKKEWTY